MVISQKKQTNKYKEKLVILQSIGIIYVTGFAKRGLIADPNSTYLETHDLTCEFGTTLKLGPNVSLTYHYYLV